MLKRRILSMILCAAMLASLFAGLSISALATDYYTREELETILADTAIAYYLKGPDCQYDSSALSGANRYSTAVQRQTLNRSPEDCSPQRRYYTVCSSFPNDVYYDVFGTNPLTPADMVDTEFPSPSLSAVLTGLRTENLTDADLEFPLALIPLTANNCAYGKKVAWLGGDDYEQGWIGHDGVVYFWGGGSYESITDAELTDLKNSLRPGDIISVIRGNVDDEDVDGAGHTMIFLGDYKGDGTKYIIHSGGSKYNAGDASFIGKTSGEGTIYGLRPHVITEDGTYGGATAFGYDIVEDSSANTRNGTIRINSFEYSLGRGQSYGPGRAGKGIQWFVVLRPLDRLINWEGEKEEVSGSTQFPKATTQLTHNAFARKQYPGLEITTTADKTEFQSVKAGDTITYSFKLENDTNLDSIKPHWTSSGKNYSGMTMTMPLPSNATYMSHTVSNDALSPVNGMVAYDSSRHAVIADGFTSAAGKTYQVDVTVQVSSAAQLRDKVVLPSGQLTGPQTEPTGDFFRLAGMTHTVCGEQPSGFESITASSVTSPGARTLMGAANDVYAALGYRLELPSTQELLNSILTYAYQPLDTSSSHWMQSRLLDENEITDPDALLLRKMVVPGYIGGHKLFTPNAAGVRTNRTRMLDFNEDYLQPGDILVYAYTGSPENGKRTISTRSETIVDPERVYVYLGDSNYAYYDYDGTFRVINAPVRTFLYDSSRARGELTTGFDRNGNSPYTAYSRYELSTVLTQAFRYSYFFCLRPSLAYASIPTMTSSVSAAYTVTIGGATTGYASLASALTAANANSASTLTLHEDATLTANQTFCGGTLDLGGHTLTTGAYTLTLGSGSTSQTLRNGTVKGDGTPVYCAGTGTSTIENAKLFNVVSGAALSSGGSAHVTLEGVEIASQDTTVLPVDGTQSNWTFADDVTVLVPSALVSSSFGNGATLGTGVSKYTAGRVGYYKIEDVITPADFDNNLQNYYNNAYYAYKPVVFAKPAVYNTTKGVNYGSLSDAISASSAGDTLTLLRDVHTGDLRETGTTSYGRTAVHNSGSNKNYTFYINKQLTIDFNGCTVFADGTDNINATAILVSGSYPVTLRNGTVFAKSAYAMNLMGTELHLDHMRAMGTTSTLMLISDSAKGTLDNPAQRNLYLENGSLLVGGLGGNSSNYAIELRYGKVYVKGGSRFGSLTGFPIYPGANTSNATTENYNTSELIVEDGGIFTGRYAMKSFYNMSTGREIHTGLYHYKNYVNTYSAVNHFTLTYLAASDSRYLREEHKEEVIDIPGSTAIIAVDRTVQRSGAAVNETTGVFYETLEAALAAAESGQTISLNGAYIMAADAAVPAGVTLDLSTYTLTVPAGVTLDASSGTMTADSTGGLSVAGAVSYSATPANRLLDNQVQMEAGGAYGTITAPSGETFSGHTVVPAPEMAKEQSLILNDKILVNYYMLDSASAYTSSSFALVDGVATPMQKEDSNWYLPVRACVAKEMGYESRVQPVGVDSAGNYHLGNESTLSIRWYAEQQIGSTNWDSDNSAKLGRAMIGMLNYGAAAQTYWGYETGDLANKNLSSADQARMTYTSANIGEHRVNTLTKDDAEGLYAASSCVLGNSQALRFYLNLPESRTDRNELTFRVTYQNYKGVQHTIEKSFAELTETSQSGCYYFEVPNMAASDVKTDVTLTVEKAGSAIATVTDSIASYCARACAKYSSDANLVALADAVLIYGLSARDYFCQMKPNTGADEMPIV